MSVETWVAWVAWQIAIAADDHKVPKRIVLDEHAWQAVSLETYHWRNANLAGGMLMGLPVVRGEECKLETE